MNEGKGKLYAVGIGPGDPDLMTLKAKQVLEKVRYIIAPVREEGDEGTALKIARERIDLSSKDVRKLVFSMEGDKEDFKECGRAAGDEIIKILMKGEDAAMIMLGDVSVYSTYMYLNEYVENAGYDTEIVPGVTSFSYAAALTKMPLVMAEEGLAIIPSLKNRNMTDAAIDNFENIVVMKSGKDMNGVSEIMRSRGIPVGNAVVVSRAGMDGQYIGPIVEDEELNYFTTVIIKKVQK